MKRTWKSFLSLLLAFAMILSLGVMGFAQGDEPEETGAEESGTVAELPFEKVDNDIISARLPFANDPVEEEEPLFADDELVRVSIVLESLSAIDAGYAPRNAKAYRAQLETEQQAVANNISAQALGGARLDVVWNLTLAGNIISAYVPYGSIEDIKNVFGVRDVFLETLYYPTEDEIENIIATEMTGATKAWNLGYTGAGSRIAIVDTGLDTDHQSFDPAAFQHAIDELNEGRETPITLMTAADVAAVWDQLNAADFIGSVDGVYLNAKVPFAVNYIDEDLDVTHDNDNASEHGSHVAGIAAANKYIPSGDGFVNALETVQTQGEAPDAQLLIMKVFGKGGGAYDSDYMAAIEDAIILGCDAVNLSLGSTAPGFTTNSTYAELLDSLVQFGLVWANSAGNNYSWSYFNNGPGGLYADDVNFQTGGSPATYVNTLSVASVDDTTGFISVPMMLPDGTQIPFWETQGYGNEPINTITGEHTFIMLLPQYAGYEEYMFGAIGSEILGGKIAVAWRGNSSFYEKANAGAANGAIGTIVCNNQPGYINMNLTGYEYTAPSVLIMQNSGTQMLYYAYGLNGIKYANGIPYLEGTIIIPEDVATTTESPYQQMSDFSSWGGNGALVMKPEITAPGGNIWGVDGSVPGGTAYEYMSGTSMASPQIAGLVAVLKQYIRESGLQAKLPDLTERAIIQSLLMSTSVPLLQADNGYYWSILKQGSGLANANNAITARTFIQITDLPESAPLSAWSSIADGKVKVEVGEVDNGFTTSFTVTNTSEEDLYLGLNGDFFTQAIDATSWTRSEYTTPVYAALSWTVNGETFVPGDLNLDFNNDGITNIDDAWTLLMWCANPETEIYNLEYADLDEDGNVDTHDAKIAFETLNSATLELAAGETATVTVSVSYNMNAYKQVNGNYIEGFLFVRESPTSDGALGVEHSIPVFGYNGNYTDASMFDRGSYLEYVYGFGDGDADYGLNPYMVVSTALGSNAYYAESFLVKYAGETGIYYFGGNPFVSEDTYMPERNAINSNDVLYGAKFTQIRNAAYTRFYVTDANEETVAELWGARSTGAYFSISENKWQNTTTTVGVNYPLSSAEEGDQLTAHVQLAIEYYVDSDGNPRWDDLGAGSEISIPFVIDNTAPEILNVYRDNSEPPTPSEDEVPSDGDEQDPYDILDILVKDNQYTAACALYNDKGEELARLGSFADAQPGEERHYTFDLLEIFGEEEVYPYLLVQVYDYAANLSTYKINFKADEEGDVINSVVVDPDSVEVYVNNSVQLSAQVRPWGLEGEVVWSSEDETIAVVDKNGVLTGVSEGTTTVTAAYAENPEVFGTCEVTVKAIHKDLNGIVWDESSDVWFAGFDAGVLPKYTALCEKPLDVNMASLTYDTNMTLYGTTFTSFNAASTLYTVNTEDWSLTEIASCGYPLVDICQAYVVGLFTNSDLMFAVYGPYVLIVDKSTGSIVSGADYSEYLGTNVYLVGITYEAIFNTDLGYSDFFFMVDEEGNVYESGFAVSGGDFTYFEPSLLGNVGLTCDRPYFQSLYFDGEDLYWSCFNYSANKVDVAMIDLVLNEDTYMFEIENVVVLGSFADGVWPVGGLFELDVNPLLSKNSLADAPERFNAVVAGSGLLPTEIPLLGEYSEETFEDEEPAEDEEPGGTIAPVGGLDKAPIEIPDVEPEKISADIIIDITAEVLSTNGKITIDYDPSTITLNDWIPMTQYGAALDQTDTIGHLVFAWVDLGGIPADEVILRLKFSTNSNGVVTITTDEENERDADADENLPRVETVFLGIPTADPHEHEFTLKEWVWAEDNSSAVAVFACACGATKRVQAVITHELTEAVPHVEGKESWTAVATFEGEEYTDEKSEILPALPCPCAHFEDMPPYGTVEHDAIDWAFTQIPKVTDGIDETHFGPAEIVIRGQAMRFLWNAAGQPDPASMDNPFTDVPEGKYYTLPVLWAYNNANRITSGTSDTEFSPKQTCNRAQIITFLWNALGKPAPTIENPYTDITKSDGSYRYYTEAAIWAYEVGIERGEGGLFSPNTDCTRVSTVVYLYRYYTGEGLAE